MKPTPTYRATAPSSRALVAKVRDLPEAIVSVSALLVMLALGVMPWIAIGLGIAIYVGVTLLRPQFGTTAPVDVESEPKASRHEPRSAGAPPLSAEVEFSTRFGLTPRECEILPLLAQRLTDREIGERLFKSPKTVMNQTASILAKLGLESRREVAAFAARHGLVFPPLPPNVDG